MACLLDKRQDVGGPVKARLHGVAQEALLKVAQVCRLPPGLCKLQRTASLLRAGSGRVLALPECMAGLFVCPGPASAACLLVCPCQTFCK